LWDGPFAEPGALLTTGHCWINLVPTWINDWAVGLHSRVRTSGKPASAAGRSRERDSTSSRIRETLEHKWGKGNAMPEKPSYLGLLNVIAVNEAKAHRYLNVWIDTTTDPEVAAVLRTVAAREGEHGMSFAKRIDELGFQVREKEGTDATDREEQMAIAASTELSDCEKIERFGLHELEKVLHFFDDIFKDHTIDIQTGELLGRYVAEEFDSARLLRACHEKLTQRSSSVAANGTSDLAELEKTVGELQRSVEELRQIVCAQSMSVQPS
jgi:rubrerythrin